MDKQQLRELILILGIVFILVGSFGAIKFYSENYDAEHNDLKCMVCGSNQLSVAINYDNPKGNQMQITCQRCGGYMKVELWNHLEDKEYLKYNLVM